MILRYNNNVINNVFIIVFLAFAALIAFSYFNSKENSPSYQTTETTLEKQTITIGSKKLFIKIADEPYEQTQGLSGKEYMAEDEGMIFIFEQSLIPAFWMKNMKFGLDIIWIDAENKIIGLEKNVSPDTYPKTFSPSSPIKYVLEVNADWSDKNQIKAGDKISF